MIRIDMIHAFMIHAYRIRINMIPTDMIHAYRIRIDMIPTDMIHAYRIRIDMIKQIPNVMMSPKYTSFAISILNC